jgi:hypothetical protein
VAKVVEPPLAACLDAVGSNAAPAEAVPASASTYSAHAAPCSEPVIRRAGCVNRARPDLWGAGEGDLPGLPDWGWARDRLAR